MFSSHMSEARQLDAFTRVVDAQNEIEVDNWIKAHGSAPMLCTYGNDATNASVKCRYQGSGDGNRRIVRFGKNSGDVLLQRVFFA